MSTTCRVLVTNSSPHHRRLADELVARGCRPTLLPLWTIGCPADGGAALRAACNILLRYHWVIFTSQFAVDAVQAILAERQARWPKKVEVAAVGEATAAALRHGGIAPRLVSPTSSAEGFVTCFAKTDIGARQMLLPQGTRATPDLALALRRMGARVDTVTAYAVTPTPIDARQWLRTRGDEPFEAVCFTAPSAAARFVELFGAPPTAAPFAESRWCAIGPVTADAMQRLRLTPVGTAKRPSFSALADVAVGASVRALPGTSKNSDFTGTSKNGPDARRPPRPD